MSADKTAQQNAQKAVAQSTAIAVQDAADNLRNLNTLSTTTIGVALAKFLETKDPTYVEVIKAAESVAKNGAEHFSDVGTKAAKILKDFSSF
ncbi:hypothetical protein [Oceanospirillum sediminis]|uniref:Uncharacterized protein n=1 Tax=Oceanospirillum sediminis TaxID=2760088 RepID=A0A839ISZ0_9GAMM|nr:hypothetical protein [Oceanospirillum sediminis]MBB1487722.1 hypothetical protein [Oceanospirillum sediminis]